MRTLTIEEIVRTRDVRAAYCAASAASEISFKEVAFGVPLERVLDAVLACAQNGSLQHPLPSWNEPRVQR